MRDADIDAQVERFKTALKGAGVRLTHQRIEIFREVLASEDHPDVESVFRRLKKRLPEVSLDTVYRTLWMATDLGLLSTVGPRQAKLRFDAKTKPHHHFVCTKCDALFDFESPELDALEIPAAAAKLGSVEAKRVEIRGVCKACGAKG